MMRDIFRSKRFSILFAYFYLCAASAQTPDPANTQLNRWPFVMAHDSGTTYLEDGLLHPINDWTKTQPSGGFKGMLECGARSFDVRPKLKDDGSLIFHHGDIEVDHSFSDAIDEIIQWLSEKTHSASNLVHLDIWDCVGGDACMESVTEVLNSKNISFAYDCTATAVMMVSEVLEKFRIDPGVSIIATPGCVAYHYNESIDCSGFGDDPDGTVVVRDADNDNARQRLRGSMATSWTYTCYADSSTKDIPLSRMWDYVDHVVPDESSIYSIQALWQETASSVAIGETYLSSLLKDESKSQLNALTASRISSGLIDASNLNIIEVNNVCDGGQAIIDAAMQARAALTAERVAFD